MIITETIIVRIQVGNYQYWKNKGYDLAPMIKRGRGDTSPCPSIEVKVSDLMKGSDATVICKCDSCNIEYSQRYNRNTDECRRCRQIRRNKNQTYGTKNKGRNWDMWKGDNNPRHKQNMNGENHPNWNPLKKPYNAYQYKVQKLTKKNYDLHKDRINPTDLPRTRCGVDGGYQLDHIVSIKKGFMLGINPMWIAAPDNLQMLPWGANRAKW